MEGNGIGFEVSMATFAGVSDVGDVTIFEVVDSSLACPRNYLGLFLAVKLELRRRGPGGDDDKKQVVCSMVFHGASCDAPIHKCALTIHTVCTIMNGDFTLISQHNSMIHI